MRYYYKVIPTASGNIYQFNNWGVFAKYYGRLFNANSGLVIVIPSMNTAG